MLKINHLYLLSLLAVSISYASTNLNQISESQERHIEQHASQVKKVEPEDALSITDLFESGDFSAWTHVNGDDVSGWSIDEGVIRRERRGGDIITRHSYDDFELRFKWKISEGGNSGVKYRTRGRLGPEYQIIDEVNHRDGRRPDRGSASIYDIMAPDENKPINPPGEWNSGRIVAQGEHLTHWLNGVKVLEITQGSDEWNEALSRSKFKDHPDFGTWSGPVLLQGHTHEVWFKEVLIREL